MWAKGLAYRNALEEQARGNLTEITPEVIKRADELYFNNLLDAEGNIDIFKDLSCQACTRKHLDHTARG